MTRSVATLSGLLLSGLFFSPATADELLPSGILNVARPEFGDVIGSGDYGLANAQPLEVGQTSGGPKEIRVFRTPHELRLSQRSDARFQVQLGDVDHIYFWIEPRRVYGHWKAQITVVFSDEYREVVFSEDIGPRIIQFAFVPPRSLLDIRISSVERAIPLSKRFRFTVSPVPFWVWPLFVPIPEKSDLN